MELCNIVPFIKQIPQANDSASKFLVLPENDLI